MAQKRTIIEANKRMTVVVNSIIGNPQGEPVGQKGAVKLSFKGVADGKELKYATFHKSLFETINAHVSKLMDCEVEISEHEHEGETYTDRTILQVYVDGKPVRQPQQSGGWQGGGQRYSGGSGYREDSPEKIASIEAQTAYNGAVALMVGKVITTGSELATKALDWGASRLSRSMNTPVAPPAEAAKPKSKSLIEAAKEQGAQEITPEEIDWDAPNVNEQDFRQIMDAAKWKDATVKSYCQNTFKVDSHGQPLDVKKELLPFVKGLTKENIHNLIVMMQSKGAK